MALLGGLAIEEGIAGLGGLAEAGAIGGEAAGTDLIANASVFGNEAGGLFGSELEASQGVLQNNFFQTPAPFQTPGLGSPTFQTPLEFGTPPPGEGQLATQFGEPRTVGRGSPPDVDLDPSQVARRPDPETFGMGSPPDIDLDPSQGARGTPGQLDLDPRTQLPSPDEGSFDLRDNTMFPGATGVRAGSFQGLDDPQTFGFGTELDNAEEFNRMAGDFSEFEGDLASLRDPNVGGGFGGSGEASIDDPLGPSDPNVSIPGSEFDVSAMPPGMGSLELQQVARGGDTPTASAEFFQGSQFQRFAGPQFRNNLAGVLPGGNPLSSLEAGFGQGELGGAMNSFGAFVGGFTPADVAAASREGMFQGFSLQEIQASQPVSSASAERGLAERLAPQELSFDPNVTPELPQTPGVTPTQRPSQASRAPTTFSQAVTPPITQPLAGETPPNLQGSGLQRPGAGPEEAVFETPPSGIPTPREGSANRNPFLAPDDISGEPESAFLAPGPQFQTPTPGEALLERLGAGPQLLQMVRDLRVPSNLGLDSIAQAQFTAADALPSLTASEAGLFDLEQPSFDTGPNASGVSSGDSSFGPFQFNASTAAGGNISSPPLETQGDIFSTPEAASPSPTFATAQDRLPDPFPFQPTQAGGGTLRANPGRFTTGTRVPFQTADVTELSDFVPPTAPATGTPGRNTFTPDGGGTFRDVFNAGGGRPLPRGVRGEVDLTDPIPGRPFVPGGPQITRGVDIRLQIKKYKRVANVMSTEIKF